MSDSEEEGGHHQKNKKEVMPEYKMRFTDMPPAQVEKAIRRKFTFSFNSLFSCR